ncbi:hypothetical protein HPP92_016373 [Vanilla planifolia]|uniref:Uncharacterized protein n=1 Tax=Vanilla planifolia TaxID=51239 RepID=A0A835QN07_VANPL|nr:hypothetical protein HPP92_016373 [Vanilla planifolia]
MFLGRERELLEELASLSETSSGRLKVRKQFKGGETPRRAEAKISEPSSSNQADIWKKLKDFAGNVANGVLKWLKDNL